MTPPDRFALAPVRAPFHALAVTIVPETAALDDAAWHELEALVDGVLASRPAALRRQLRAFIRVLQWLPLLRFGRAFTALDRTRRARFLAGVEASSLTLVRRGFWGLRTLVLTGYYGRAQGALAIGYRPDLRGWGGRR
jgi:hypothetical protein